MITALPLVLLLWVLEVTALEPIRSASFVKQNAYKVSSLEKCPSGFANVQQRNIISPISISKGADGESSTDQQISLDTGVFILSSDSSYEAFYLNVSIDDVSYPLLLDTASPYVWVYGDNCTSNSCQGQQLYTPTTNESETLTFDLAYSSSTASGYITQVNLTINGELSVQQFNVGVAQSVPDIFQGYNISGVIGLPSSDDTSLNGLKNLVEVLYDSGSTNQELFTVLLNNGSTNYDGVFTVGKIIPELYEGNISYTDIIDNDESYWKMEIDNVFVDGYPVTFNDEQNINGQATNDSRLAIVDSGTTILVLNKKDAATLHSFFNNSVSDGTNFAIYCNETKSIDLQIGDLNFTIDSTSYVGTQYPESSRYYGYCVSNFQGLDVDDEGSWILGGLFLKTVYTVFDYEQQRIGFAYKNSNDISFMTQAAATSTIVDYTSGISSVSAVTAQLVSSFANSSSSITQTTSRNLTSTLIASSTSSSGHKTNSSSSTASVNMGDTGLRYNAILTFISLVGALLMV